jgi:hypothetical protein
MDRRVLRSGRRRPGRALRDPANHPPRRGRHLLKLKSMTAANRSGQFAGAPPDVTSRRRVTIAHKKIIGSRASEPRRYAALAKLKLPEFAFRTAARALCQDRVIGAGAPRSPCRRGLATSRRSSVFCDIVEKTLSRRLRHGHFQVAFALMTLILSNQDVEKLLTMRECIDVLEEAYIELSEGRGVNRRRSDCLVPSARDAA